MQNLSILEPVMEWEMSEFGASKLKGFYRKGYAKHTDFDGNEDNEIDVIVLTHVDYIIFEEYPINFILKLIKLFSEGRG